MIAFFLGKWTFRKADLSNFCEMLIKVKTLTGKEIELDIEPNDKVERIKEKVGVSFFFFLKRQFKEKYT